MSEASLDLREQIVRIDRATAETQKFQGEASKLRTEGAKLTRERTTLVLTSARSELAGG